MPTSNYVDKIKQDGTSYDIHDTELRNSKGQANGIASLDATGKVPSSQLPDSTDSKVTQTATTTDANYEILFSETADNTTRTEGAGKAATLRFNPSKGALMEGYLTCAIGDGSHAEGQGTTAKSAYSHAEGFKTSAGSTGTHVEGNRTTACNLYAHAEGEYTYASGDASHAEGTYTTASGGQSHAEGTHTIAEGDGSHAEGYVTNASGYYSHAEGSDTIASGYTAHAEGYLTCAIGAGSHAEGGYTTASAGGGTFATGENSHTEGYHTIASGITSHAEGSGTTANDDYTHAEGYNTSAFGLSSHAEGYSSIATHNYTHAEGFYTCASGINSHAEGEGSVTSGRAAHAEGLESTASGIASHSEGYRGFASGNGAHAEGGYASAGDYLGTFAIGENSHAEGYLTTASGKNSHAEGNYTCANGIDSHAEGTRTKANSTDSHAEGSYTYANGTDSHAEGYRTSALAYASHAEGYATSASGSYSHAEGSYNSASGKNSHAEGNYTCANGTDSHAEGYQTRANSADSHAEGSYTCTSGTSAHAEGYDTIASGKYSHAAGEGTCAAGQAQTVVGKFNIADTTSLFIIGNGTSSARSNALLVASDGATTLGASGSIASGNSQAVTGGAVYTALGNKLDASLKGAVNGVAELGSDGKVPSAQLPTIPAAQIQSDYTQNDNTKLDYIKNKPTLGTAAAKNVPSSGDASTTEVVMGNDTRLTDSRNAKDVYSWAKASTKPTYTASEVGAIATTAKGAANGVAELDANGLVPSSQLPSYVDDIIEVADYAHLPITGESGKIYITLDTDLTYRWSGTTYVEVSKSLALGETSSTAYRGDRGKTAYDHATETRLTTATASGLYKVAATKEGHIASLTAVTKADITALGIPGSDTNTTYSLTQDSSDGHKITLTPSSGSAKTVTIPDNDSKVTSSANHYTPATASGQDKSASASGATAAWSIDVVKGVTLNTDGKGHVTGISVTSGKIPGNPNTDRYVNSAAFADDTTNNANSPVKMTLTRAGSDTATVTANIPKVSSSGAGVVPKGAAVSSQSQSTKFLREDGTWAAPSYTSIPANNITGSGTSGYLTKFNGTNTVTNGPALGSDTTKYLRNDGSWATPTDTNTHRPIQVNGTEILGNNTTALNLKAGSNVSLSNDGGTVTIAATDTKYTAATAAPGNIATSGAVGTSTNYARQDHTHGISLATGDSNGQVKIAGQNVSVKGLGSLAYMSSISADYIAGGYLNIHPENSPTLIPFMNNDIAYLLKRGGSAIIKYDSTTQSIDLTNCFDASPSYWAINPTGVTTITIELTLHKEFTWTNTVYIDFGSSSWRSKSVKIEAMNSNYSGDTWAQKYYTTTNALGHCYVITSHTPTGASSAGGGFNKLRFTLSDWVTATIFRIAQIGIYNYGSSGLRETFIPKDGGNIYGTIYPNSNNGADLGTSSNKFNNIYATTIYENGTALSSKYAASSHTHNVGQITWAGGQNFTTSASANNAEWSLDLNSGTYTGGYFHVWSGKNSKSILMCYNDTNAVTIPSGSLTVSGGKLFATKAINQLLTGSGTTAQDKGSGVSPRYFPAKWTMNVGIATPADGDMVTIKIPCAGHDFGVFLSLDNGTTYKPIGLKTQDNGRLTTHYPNGRIITLMYDSTAVVDQVFAAAGADARSNITGAWKVITSYLDGNTYDRTVYNQAIKAGSSAIVSGNIIVGKDGVYHHLKDGTAFDITYPILHAQTGINANSTGTWVFIATPFSVATTQSMTLTAYLPVYIKGTLSGTIFTPVSTTPLIQTIPTSEDGYYYMKLGIATNTTTIYLEYEHKIFSYRHNSFSEIVRNATFTTLLKPIVANTSTGVSNWGVPSGSYQVWGQQFSDNRLKYTPSGGSETTVTDTGDWTMWLTGNGTSNTATLNMRIDGTFFATSFNGNLSGNASTATSATKATQDSDGNAINTTYLKKSGGTITGALALNGDLQLKPSSSSSNDSPDIVWYYGNGQEKARLWTADTYSAASGLTYRLYKSDGTSLYSGTIPLTDTKNTAGSTDTSSKIFLIGATSQAANPQTYSDDQVYTTSGTLQTNITKATSVINANSAGSGTVGGLALYSDANPDVYGVAFRTTANSGKHGYVQSDWATYLTMSNSDNRGWIFRRQSSGNVASINTSGHAVFNGSVTVGGNAANTSGARMVYDSTSKAINFEFL